MPNFDESFKKEEAKLQAQLRRICSSKGEELYPSKSAEIFAELGLLFQAKSPDKFSLIQSAALFNAAIVRQPSNKKFHGHLQNLC